MNLVKSIMGRRKFLIAAGATSASASTLNDFVGANNPAFNASVANAAEKPRTADIKTADNRYSHLLSPVKIRNTVIKNRLIHTVGIPHFLQGPETWPSDVYREYYARFARNGAAIVVVPGVVVSSASGTGRPVSRKGTYQDSAHMERFDASDPACENYFDQIIEAVHACGSLAAAGGMGGGGMGPGGGPNQNAKQMIEAAVARARALEDKGIDVMSMGGNFRDENSVKQAIDQIQAVKSATNMIIAMSLNVRGVFSRPETFDMNVLTETTVENVVKIAKMYEGTVDILQFRCGAAIGSHPSTWQQEEGKPNSLIIAKAIRDSGAKIHLAPNGGFQDLDENEHFIASGQCDFIAMIRPFHADFEYAQKAYEGRGEDVVPCVQCNKCHGLSMEGPWTSVCSVNPKLGLEPAVRVITRPLASMKVAVIGGGPGGMVAAITAAERGHKVTLYEKGSVLGGLLLHADYSPYKWALKRYKNYLVRQVGKARVEVYLNTKATPEMIKAKGYDAIIAAVGAEPNMPRIPGWEGKNVYDILGVYGKEKELGKNVVVIGGGEYGVETGMFLAKKGHKTTMLTSGKELLPAKLVHYEEIMTDVYEHLDGFSYVLGSAATRIADGKVFYADSKGNEMSIQADSVVLYAGLKARQDEALRFYGSSKNAFFIVGDCTGKCGDVQKAVRNAYFTASQI
jgi:2,4-dienoyl-CoA reductase-like NADH-dependent reductase (Old Yellow Enzyme family)/thioredoxin reductase